jgi:hypothetical protein
MKLFLIKFTDIENTHGIEYTMISPFNKTSLFSTISSLSSPFGPALIKADTKNIKNRFDFAFFKNGSMHNECGPAEKKGEKFFYYINGEKFSKEKYLESISEKNKIKIVFNEYWFR